MVLLRPCEEDCQPGQYACSQSHKTEIDHFFGNHNQNLKDHLSTPIHTARGAAHAHALGFEVVKVECAKLQLQLRQAEKEKEAKIVADNRKHYLPAQDQTPPRLTLAQQIRSAAGSGAGPPTVPMLTAPVPQPFSPDVKTQEPAAKKSKRSTRSNSVSASQE